MGGGQYSFDVAREARSTARQRGSAFDYSGYATDSGTATASRKGVHQLLDVRGQTRECMNDQAIVVALDVTRSRGNDSKVVYEKLPTLIGWLELQGYLPGAAISLAAVGDANSDQAPVQISQWERDNRLDAALSKFWIEEGGGGTGEESYELVAYYYARHTRLKINEQGRKGYFFFVGDESFYPRISREQVRRVLGHDIPADIPTHEIFRELQQRFHCFLIYPKKSFQERRADIDAEIAQRVRSAGGRYDDVDVRVSLLWNTHDDLDLHVTTPAGEEIYYGNKLARCGGELDVDRNVRGETDKPVENVRWKKGEARPGEYRVVVQNFRFHERHPRPVEYKVEIDVGGEIRHFEGLISPKLEEGVMSNQLVYRFHFDPAQRPVKGAAKGAEGPADRYAGYDDAVILKQWYSVLPREHVLLLDDPQDIIEVMVGAIGLMEQRTDLDTYLSALDADNPDAAQRQKRRTQVGRAIGELALSTLPTAGFSLGDLPSGA